MVTVAAVVVASVVVIEVVAAAAEVAAASAVVTEVSFPELLETRIQSSSIVVLNSNRRPWRWQRTWCPSWWTRWWPWRPWRRGRWPQGWQEDDCGKYTSIPIASMLAS